jgi:hypothetical protein
MNSNKLITTAFLNQANTSAIRQTPDSTPTLQSTLSFQEVSDPANPTAKPVTISITGRDTGLVPGKLYAISIVEVTPAG